MESDLDTEKPPARAGVSAQAVRDLIVARYADSLAAVGVAADEVPDELDLRDAGVIDSLGFLELVVTLEDQLGASLDFETLDPDLLTTVGPLAHYVAAQVAGTPEER